MTRKPSRTTAPRAAARPPRFPTSHRAGVGLLLVALAAMALASGLPGVAGGNAASAEWLDYEAREAVRLDAQVEIVGLDAGEDQAIVRTVRARRRAAGRGRRPAVYRRDFKLIAYREARKAGIRRPGLFVRQMAAESGYQPCSKSGASAYGIAQIIPSTARSWKVDPWIPEDALAAAAKHMARYERQLGSYPLALAAYNAGPGAVQQYGGIPPYAETRTYIHRVMDSSYRLPGMSQTFIVRTHMGPVFSARLRALMLDVRRHGGTIAVEEGWRSYEDSMQIWKAAKRKYGGWERARKWAAPPGCSNHVRGWAADLTFSRNGRALAHRLAARHGLVFPMSHEPWHVELRGIPTQSG